MSEAIEITAGKNGEYIAVFDGQVLELFGQSEGSARYRASHVIFKREKPSKDGSASVRVYTANGDVHDVRTRESRSGRPPARRARSCRCTSGVTR